MGTSIPERRVDLTAATIVVDSRAVDYGAARLIQAAEEADGIERS
jgi:hypothetical protein